MISFILCFKDLRNQNVIGFYRTYDDSGYTWTKCDTNCYTCIAGAETDSVHTDHSNQNCLSCDENKGKYFYEEEYNKNIKNCYNKEEMEELLLTSPFFLDTKQNPPKWAKCYDKCLTCSKKPKYDILDPTKIIQMNCDTCDYTGYIKANTFCYQIAGGSKGFTKDGITSYCKELYDDKTGKQLGIFDEGNECIIKPDNTYFDENNLLNYCENNCGLCEFDTTRDSNNFCLKCINNFIMNKDSTDCECPKYLGLETSTSNNCVNCKYSPDGPYNYDGHCVSSRKIDNINYSIINITYNIISKCKRPCLKCDSNGRCSSCRTNYYYDKEAYNKNKDNNKICLTYKECLDIGIPLIDFNLCYNCKEHNGYKLPNTNDCVSSVDNLNTYYYYKYAEYNALGRCHKKCNGCFGAPKGEKEQNCRDCLDTGNYVYNETTHNCDKIEIEIKEDKCPNLLYYIDNSETDIDKKKKCIPEGNLCPDDYPYLIQYLNLCVEKCPENNFIEWNEDIPIITYNTHENQDLIFKNILDNTCVHFSNDKDYILDFWEYFDEKITNERYSIFYYFYPYYGRNLETYNDGQSLYIFGEDTTLHITRLSVENSYIFKNQKNNNFEYNSNSNYFDKYYFFINNGEYYSYRNTRRVSIIYLSECEKLIKRLNNILDSTDLLLLKLDIYRNDTKNEIMTNKVEYKIYHPTGDFEFDLEICDNYPINIITPTYIYEGLEENKKLLKVLRNVVKKGYEPFILYSNFYTETCEQYSNEDNVDMTLKDRRKYIYEKIKNFKFCEKNCYYKSTDENINFVNCICKAKKTITPDIDDLSFNTLDEENEQNYLSEKLSQKLNDIEKNKINDYFNFYLVKCYKLLFSKKGFYYNYALAIIIILFVLYILFMLFYFCVGFDNYINELKKFLFIKYLGKDSITKIYYTKKTEENNNNISFDDDLKEKETNLYRKKKIQNRTNSDNIYNRQYKFNVHDPNKWIRENKSSILSYPVKDDQIKVVNDYKYKSNNLYKNTNTIQNDYENINNKNNNNDDKDIINNDANPPKRKNNNYYSMEHNNDLINARTVNPITNKNYDYVEDALNGKKKTKNNNIDNNNIISSVEEIKNEDIDKNEEINNKNKIFNKKSEEHNTTPAIYIYNLILENDIEESKLEEIEEKKMSNIITKREYSFLNDGEINELDFDNSFTHDKRNFIRIYYSFIKYNLLIFFSFLVYEDFNVSFAKIALFINYLILYLTFNTMFFNNNSIHNIYIKEGNYDIGYHSGKILGAFVLSLIFIKLIQLWITFNRRKSLKMKLMKRYTDSKNEILRMIEKYYLNLRIYFPISLIVIIFICFYASVVCAVYINSHKYLILNWIICIIFHFVYSLILNFIPTILRYLSLKENNNKNRTMYKASRIISYFL